MFHHNPAAIVINIITFAQIFRPSVITSRGPRQEELVNYVTGLIHVEAVRSRTPYSRTRILVLAILDMIALYDLPHGSRSSVAQNFFQHLSLAFLIILANFFLFALNSSLNRATSFVLFIQAL